MKVIDNKSGGGWLRVWSKFKEIPDLYTIWIGEVSSSESWGYSTSSYKMKKIEI